MGVSIIHMRAIPKGSKHSLGIIVLVLFVLLAGGALSLTVGINRTDEQDTRTTAHSLSLAALSATLDVAKSVSQESNAGETLKVIHTPKGNGSPAGNPGQTNQLTVNGQSVTLPVNGEAHEVRTTSEGNVTVDIQSQTSQGSSTLDISIESSSGD
jgi:hypothetical protein